MTTITKNTKKSSEKKHVKDITKKQQAKKGPRKISKFNGRRKRKKTK